MFVTQRTLVLKVFFRNRFGGHEIVFLIRGGISPNKEFFLGFGSSLGVGCLGLFDVKGILGVP